jgi:hypothetical protein
MTSLPILPLDRRQAALGSPRRVGQVAPAALRLHVMHVDVVARRDVFAGDADHLAVLDDRLPALDGVIAPPKDGLSNSDCAAGAIMAAQAHVRFRARSRAPGSGDIARGPFTRRRLVRLPTAAPAAAATS